MWFGTADGLNKFDGYSFAIYRHVPLDSHSISFKNIPFVSEDRTGMFWVRGAGGQLNSYDRLTDTFTEWFGSTTVTALIEDGSGTIWLTRRGEGLSRFDRAQRRFIHYSLGSDTVYALCESRHEGPGILWAGTARGLERFASSTGTSMTCKGGPTTAIRALLEDRSGVLWLGTEDGLWRYDHASQRFFHYPRVERGSGKPGDADVRLMYEDKTGVLWVGTQRGISRLEKSTGRFVEYRCGRVSPPMPGGTVKAIYEDRTGTLWIGTLGAGLGRYDRVKKQFSFYLNNPKNPESISDNNVNAICEDKSGTLWFGTVTGGVNKIDKSVKGFRSFTQDPLIPGSLSQRTVAGITEDASGTLWVATLGGLNRFDKSTESFKQFVNHPGNVLGLSTNVLWGVLEDSQKMLWVGTRGQGLERFDRERKIVTHFTHNPDNPRSLGDNFVLSLLEDRTGRLWIGTSGGVLDCYERKSRDFLHFRSDPRDSGALSGEWVNALLEDRMGTLWVGTSGGLQKLNKGSGDFTHYRCDPKIVNSLSSNAVYSLCEDSRGTLWIGTGAGLNRFDVPSGSFTHFTLKNGLASDNIDGILEDEHGFLWLGTGKGVSRLDPRTGSVRNYDAADGVRIQQCWGQSSFKSKTGEMYFGGINGFVRFHPDSIRDNPYVPPVVISAFKTFDRFVQLDTVVSEKSVVRLSYKENVFAFEFVALNYSSAQKNQYAYKLDGFDDDWIYCGTRHTATYTNLDGGEYAFRVKGSNNDGVWNEEGVVIAVIITPPFWATWWFRGFAFIALLVSVGGIIRYFEMRKLKKFIAHLEQERALERERIRISQDLHDEVGASLSQIAIISELAIKNSGKTGAVTPQLQSISQLAGEVVDSISAIVWAINPHNDKLDNLMGYMREYASDFFESTPIECRFDFPDELPRSPLSAEVRRTIFLVMKEALNNVAKHSCATVVQITLRVTHAQIELRIEDNGKGFAGEHMASHGNGLRNMKTRIEDIHGTCDIQSEPDNGTRIRLVVPGAREIPL
jgi:ligand-binding sensor domain-containing protein/signal transduction histidine kinase